MGTVVIAILIVAALGLAMKYLMPQQKPGKTCRSCPEFKSCGGGRPRCIRRSKSV